MNKRNEKKQNLTMIIEMLRRYGAMTQARLKEYCGLQASTVSYLVSDLKQYGVIKDSGAEIQQQPKIGKPGNVIELDNNDSQFLGMYVEDWVDDKSEILDMKLQQFFERLNNAKKVNTSTSTIDKLFDEVSEAEHSPMGMLFQNGIESVMEEFGESVPAEEKIAILTNLIKKML